MAKMEAPLTAFAEETLQTLEQCGCLLVSGKMEKANVMTIGWGLIGRLWGKPFFMVAVRPSRHTYGLIEETGEFTVNVPRRGMEGVVEFCGSVSGRDHDKFREQGLTSKPSKRVDTPIISECIIHYECRVEYKTKILPSDLPGDILSGSYPREDYHTLYFGEILATRAEEDAEAKLPS